MVDWTGWAMGWGAEAFMIKGSCMVSPTQTPTTDTTTTNTTRPLGSRSRAGW